VVRAGGLHQGREGRAGKERDYAFDQWRTWVQQKLMLGGVWGRGVSESSILEQGIGLELR
jgi:hypothetical protein